MNEGKMVLLTATIAGEKRSVVLPQELWETEIALIVRKYTKVSTSATLIDISVPEIVAKAQMGRTVDMAEIEEVIRKG